MPSASLAQSGFILILIILAIWLVALGLYKVAGRLLRPSRTYGARFANRVREQGLVLAFQRRFPRVSGFLARRLSPETFSGLPLTLLIAAILYIGFLLTGIVEELFESEEIETVDAAVFALVEPLRSEAMLDIFLWITHFGDVETLLAVTVVISAMLAAHGPRRFILPLWIAVIGAQMTSWGGKFFFDRTRPEFILDITYTSPSFPSGHATGSVSVYLLLAYILLRDLRRARLRFEIFFWLALLALLVAFSRIFLGVHYPSDVAAGILIGLFWVLAAIAVAEMTKSKARKALADSDARYDDS